MSVARLAHWTTLTLLALLGVAAALQRAVHVGDSAVRVEGGRLQTMPSIPRVPDQAR